jgi:hypothetical protein
MRKLAGPIVLAVVLASGTPLLAQSAGSSSGQASGNGAVGGYSNTTNTPSSSGTAAVSASGHKVKRHTGASGSSQDTASMPGSSNNGSQYSTSGSSDGGNSPSR